MNHGLTVVAHALSDALIQAGILLPGLRSRYQEPDWTTEIETLDHLLRAFGGEIKC